VYWTGQKSIFPALIACFITVVFWMSPAYAAPTINSRSQCVRVPLSVKSRFPRDAGTLQFNNLNGPAFAETAKSFFSPTDSSQPYSASAAPNIQVLPPLPGAVLMAFTGFLCVTFVKDRRFWIAALAALLWAGQFGMITMPRLALGKTQNNINKLKSQDKLAYPELLEIASRLRSDIEGTHYIGLLHHLEGIPALNKTSLPNYGSGKNTDKYRLAHNIVLPKIYPISTFYCLAAKAEQIIHFSPAFIFQLIPRGPPNLD